jgi:hypothetical protein
MQHAKKYIYIYIKVKNFTFYIKICKAKRIMWFFKEILLCIIILFHIYFIISIITKLNQFHPHICHRYSRLVCYVNSRDCYKL